MSQFKPLQYKSIALFGVLLFTASSVAAEDEDIHIHPLMTLPEALQQVQTDCASRPYDHQCIKEIERIENDIRKLRKVCKKNRQDIRCDALRLPDRNKQSKFAQFCQDNPENKSCIRMREMVKRSALQKMIRCKRNPDSPRCRPPVTKPDTSASLEEYCNLNPDKRSCKQFFRNKAAKRKEVLRKREKEAGDFTF